MKRIISVLLIAALAVSMFCVSFSSNAAGEIIVKFHSNHSSVADVFKSESISSGDTVDSDYDIPDVGERFIFKGWYYGKEDNARAVNFASDTFSEDTDIYAHWADAGVVKPDDSDVYNTNRGTYDDFDLAGVQVKAGEFTDTENGGLRFIASLSNSLLSELDALSDSTVGIYNSRVEYGFVAARKAAVESWKAYGTSRNYDLSEYKIGYNDTNVNGVDTTAHDENYQGIVKNIDCTASDYSQSNITDHKKFDDYRLYTVAVTYPRAKSDSEEYTDEELEAFKNADVAVRAYLRYYDANGLLRTTYDDYNGIDSYGGLCTSYQLTKSKVVDVGYYSSLSTAVSDANSLVVTSADSTPENAVCSMYISGSTAYLRLLKNTSVSQRLSFDVNADFNLNGYTLNNGAERIASKLSFSMYKGTYRVNSSAQTFTYHAGAVSILKDINFEAEGLTVENFFGVLCDIGCDAVYIVDCNFNIRANSTVKTCNGTFFNGSHCGYVTGCNYTIETAGNRAFAIYATGSSLEVDGCDIAIAETQEKANANAFPITAYNSVRASVKNTDISITGDYNEECGVVCQQTKKAGDANYFSCYFSAEKLNVSIKTDDLYPTSEESPTLVFGMKIDKEETASLNDVTINIEAQNATGDVPVSGIICFKNADVKASDIKIDIARTNSQEDSYYMNGISMYDNSNLLLTSANIKVQPVLDLRGGGAGVEQNVGIGAYGNSTVTIDPEKDEDVFIQGGNAALANGTDAYFKVTGGNFCSPTHGGAYFGGNADITGGKYYSYYMAGHTEEGAFYVTHNAIVNISNAQLITAEASRALRTRNNKDANGNMVYGNPVINVSNSFLKGLKYGAEISSGTVYLNSGVTIQAKYDYTGNVVDNRNN